MNNRILYMTLFLMLFGCKQGDTIGSLEEDMGGISTETSEISLETIDIPADFTFTTLRKINIEIHLEDSQGHIRPQTKIMIFKEMKTFNGGPQEDASTEIPSVLLAQGYTNDEGTFTETVTLPMPVDKAIVVANVFGVENIKEVSLTEGVIHLTI